MRVDRRLAIVVELAALACARAAFADEPSSVPDPTAVTRVPEIVPAPDAPAPDPCEADPRCRVERFRIALAHRRRAEYVLRVEAAARAMEDRLWQARPFRLRYPWAVDLRVDSNLALPGGQVSLAPIWFFRMEAFVGRYSHERYYVDPTNTNYGDSSVSGYVFGTQGRFTPLRFPLSPYVTLGWAYLGASLNYYSSSDGTTANTDATAHMITLGTGLDLLLPYFHLSLGYLFVHAFYVQSSVNSMHDDATKPVLRSLVDDNHHGVAFSIGSAF